MCLKMRVRWESKSAASDTDEKMYDVQLHVSTAVKAEAVVVNEHLSFISLNQSYKWNMRSSSSS